MKNILITLIAIIVFQMASAEEAPKAISLTVTENGFEPSEVKVKPGTHVILKITRKTDVTCATQIQIKEKKIKKDLPLNKEVAIDVGTLSKGDIRFACGMDMVTGHIVAE